MTGTSAAPAVLVGLRPPARFDRAALVTFEARFLIGLGEAAWDAYLDGTLKLLDESSFPSTKVIKAFPALSTCLGALKTLTPLFLATASVIWELKPPALTRSCIESAIGSSTPAKFSFNATDDSSPSPAPFAADLRGAILLAAVAGLVAGLAAREAAVPAAAVAGLADADPFWLEPSVKSTKAAPLVVSFAAL